MLGNTPEVIETPIKKLNGQLDTKLGQFTEKEPC